jgi:hypothetical protein
MRKRKMEGSVSVAQWQKKWCPFTYEYLPDFCFTCGIIGHTDKECSFRLGKGDKQLYTKNLKANLSVPGRRMSGEEDRGQWSSGRGGGSGRSNNSGGRGSWSRSDVESWRNRESSLQKGGLQNQGEEKEVTSPLKLKHARSTPTVQTKLVFSEHEMLVDNSEVARVEATVNQEVVENVVQVAKEAGGEATGGWDCKGQHILIGGREKAEKTKEAKGDATIAQYARKNGNSAEKKGRGSFKRLNRKEAKDISGGEKALLLGYKRDSASMDVDGLMEEERRKRQKGMEIEVEKAMETNLDAGLLIQPCSDQ